ncbi:MAG TPA: hypothetical protein VFH47_01775 [Candidatus Thermoplasmatota archaeon]|nr:hypothetical protein [Candidatus Thermoplasmatota archaeon]
MERRTDDMRRDPYAASLPARSVRRHGPAPAAPPNERYSRGSGAGTAAYDGSAAHASTFVTTPPTGTSHVQDEPAARAASAPRHRVHREGMTASGRTVIVQRRSRGRRPASRPARLAPSRHVQWGLARSCAVVLGLAFAALSAGNFYWAANGGGGGFGGIPVHGSVVVGVVHALVAVVLLAGALVRERAARGVVAVAGVLLAALAVFGAVLPAQAGDAFWMGGAFPQALVAFYGVCAAVCLLCAVLPTPRRRVVHAEPAGAVGADETETTIVTEDTGAPARGRGRY